MGARRSRLDYPRGAETAAVRVVRALYRRAWRAILDVVGRTWPRTTEADLRRAVLAALDREATVRALARIALTVRGSMHRQLAALLPELPRWRPDLDRGGAEAWAEDAYAAILAGLVGAVADAKSRPAHGPPTPVLNSVMARLRALRASNEEIVAVLEDLREIAPASELAAISRVRGRVLGYAAKANREKQEDAGIKRYTWITRRDGRVRPRHLELHGTIQRWSKPPIIRPDGTRGHPGEDHNCRCVAEPIPNRESERIKARRARAARG